MLILASAQKKVGGMESDQILRKHTSLLVRTVDEINTHDGFSARMDSLPFNEHPAGYKVQPIIRISHKAQDSKQDFWVALQWEPPWINQGVPIVCVFSAEPFIQGVFDAMQLSSVGRVRPTDSCPKACWIAYEPDYSGWQRQGWPSPSYGTLTGENVVNAISFCLEQASRLTSIAARKQVPPMALLNRFRASTVADLFIWIANESR